ncbi:hypothetical protein INR49_022806, partial [Caranx melampygus]
KQHSPCELTTCQWPAPVQWPPPVQWPAPVQWPPPVQNQSSPLSSPPSSGRATHTPHLRQWRVSIKGSVKQPARPLREDGLLPSAGDLTEGGAAHRQSASSVELVGLTDEGRRRRRTKSRDRWTEVGPRCPPQMMRGTGLGPEKDACRPLLDKPQHCSPSATLMISGIDQALARDLDLFLSDHSQQIYQYIEPGSSRSRPGPDPGPVLVWSWSCRPLTFCDVEPDSLPDVHHHVTLIQSSVQLLDVLQDHGEVAVSVEMRETGHSSSELLVLVREVLGARRCPEPSALPGSSRTR